ncbi:type II secretion system protein N [Psychrobacter aestuarii]|nr:type II secretion system protein N [Psychrobacter aestuarii]
MTALKPWLARLQRTGALWLFLAIVWLCWVGARLLWLLLAPPTAPALPVVPLMSQSSPAAQNNALFALFADAAPSTAPAPPPPNVSLTGVLLAEPASLSSAMLAVNGEVHNYRIGSTLKGTQYTLVAVDWNTAVISDAQNKQIVVRLADNMSLDQKQPAPNAVSNERLPEMNNGLPAYDGLANLPNIMPNAPAVNPNVPPSNNDDRDSGAAPAPSSNPASAVDSAAEALSENPASYLSRMGVMASGNGYQVTAAMPANIRNRLGLESGDRVLSVNGQNVGSNPTQDAALLKQVQQSGEAQIQVQRGEQVITIRQQF